MTRIASLLALLAVLAFAACVGPLEKSDTVSAETAAVPIYLVSQGWHTDLVVPRAAIPSGLWPESEDFPGADYLAIGWGDRDFYQAPETGVWMTLKAALLPTASVLHVTGFSGGVKQRYPYSEVIELKTSADGFTKLCRFIHASFLREGRRAAPLTSGHYPNSRFYPAQGTFHLFRTCNAWTASALRAGGFPVRPLAALLSGSLMSQVRPLGQPVR